MVHTTIAMAGVAQGILGWEGRREWEGEKGEKEGKAGDKGSIRIKYMKISRNCNFFGA